jgi:hypothetical protein
MRDGKEVPMPRRVNLTSELYRAARISNNLHAATEGPSGYARRVVRRKVYAKQMGLTRALLRSLGVSR